MDLIERDYELYAATNGITAIQTGRLAQSGLTLFQPSLYLRVRNTSLTLVYSTKKSNNLN